MEDNKSTKQGAKPKVLSEKEWYDREYDAWIKRRGSDYCGIRKQHKGEYCEECDHPRFIDLYPKYMAKLWEEENKDGSPSKDAGEAWRCPLSDFLFHRIEAATCPLCEPEKFMDELHEFLQSRVDGASDSDSDDDFLLCLVQDRGRSFVGGAGC